MWKEARVRLGPVHQGGDLVFCQEDGAALSLDVVSRHFRRLVERTSGLPKIRFHDLRHTHATFMLTKGIHPKVLSERLGHAQVTTTLDTYSHVLPNIQEEAGIVAAEILREAKVTKS